MNFTTICAKLLGASLKRYKWASIVYCLFHLIPLFIWIGGGDRAFAAMASFILSFAMLWSLMMSAAFIKYVQ